MSAKVRKQSRKLPPSDRRAPPGEPGSEPWLKGLLGRPVALEPRAGELHMVLVDRRREPGPADAPDLEPLHDELRVRLLAAAESSAAAALPELALVHDTLGREGWAGVGALPSKLIGRALAQAGTLAATESSSALAAFVDQLRLLHLAAELREQRDLQPEA